MIFAIMKTGMAKFELGKGDYGSMLKERVCYRLLLLLWMCAYDNINRTNEKHIMKMF